MIAKIKMVKKGMRGKKPIFDVVLISNLSTSGKGTEVILGEKVGEKETMNLINEYKKRLLYSEVDMVNYPQSI